MPGHCETFDHTADVGLRARAGSLADRLSALGEGLADLICPRENVRAAQERRCDVTAEDREALTVDFLWEIMSAIQYDRFAVAEVCVERAEDTFVRSVLRGEALDGDRHELAAEVKAVTYHQLRVARDGDAWTAQVILDL